MCLCLSPLNMLLRVVLQRVRDVEGKACCLQEDQTSTEWRQQQISEAVARSNLSVLLRLMVRWKVCVLSRSKLREQAAEILKAGFSRTSSYLGRKRQRHVFTLKLLCGFFPGWKAPRSFLLNPDFYNAGLRLMSNSRLTCFILFETSYVANPDVSPKRQAVCPLACIVWPDFPRLQSFYLGVIPLHLSQGEYDEAESECARAQAAQAKARGQEHPEVASLLCNRASLLQDQVRARDNS